MAKIEVLNNNDYMNEFNRIKNEDKQSNEKKFKKEKKIFNIEESSFNHYFTILKKKKNEIQKREKLKKLLSYE